MATHSERLLSPLKTRTVDGTEVFEHVGPITFQLGDAYQALKTAVSELEPKDLPLLWRGNRKLLYDKGRPTIIPQDA